MGTRALLAVARFVCRPIGAESTGVEMYLEHLATAPTTPLLNLNLALDSFDDALDRLSNWNTIFLRAVPESETYGV